jgi:hypothetical protein
MNSASPLSKDPAWREQGKVGWVGQPWAEQGSLIYFFCRCATTPNFDQDQQWAYCLEHKKVEGTAHSLWSGPGPSPLHLSWVFSNYTHWDSEPSPSLPTFPPSLPPQYPSEGEF